VRHTHLNTSQLAVDGAFRATCGAPVALEAHERIDDRHAAPNVIAVVVGGARALRQWR
jgi:hypothetical protein